MKNVYDIRNENNLFFTLPETGQLDPSLSQTLFPDTAIILYLYYEDTLDRYLHYLNHIPEGIAVYIISSLPSVLDAAEVYVAASGRTGVGFREKELLELYILLIIRLIFSRKLTQRKEWKIFTISEERGICISYFRTGC